MARWSSWCWMCEHREGACLLDERGCLKLKGCEVLAAGQTCLLGGLRIRWSVC